MSELIGWGATAVFVGSYGFRRASATRMVQGFGACLWIWIHGGPEGQDVFGFDPWALFLAQEGYVVLKPNYRGSSGSGERFRNLNVEDSGGGELDDVVAGAQYLVAQGLTEPGRIAIGGGSQGGTMVAYAVTKQPTLFKVALEPYGVVDAGHRAGKQEVVGRPARSPGASSC